MIRPPNPYPLNFLHHDEFEEGMQAMRKWVEEHSEADKYDWEHFPDLAERIIREKVWQQLCEELDQS